jgi:hypothetical protein
MNEIGNERYGTQELRKRKTERSGEGKRLRSGADAHS